MTRYLSAGPFNVYAPGGKEYRDNYDAIDWSGSKQSVKAERAPIQEQVAEFHKVYDVPVANTPIVPDHYRMKLRLKLVCEEFFELLAACEIWPECLCGGTVQDIVDRYIDNDIGTVNLVEVADALADIAYVVEGFNQEMGIDSLAVLAEVHRSNMSKLGGDGKPMYRDDGKVVKGPGFTPPDIKSVLGF